MSEPQIELPPLCPQARQGKAYQTDLKAIFKYIRWALQRDARDLTRSAGGKFTLTDGCYLALRYRVHLSAMFVFLEELGVVPAGTYDSLKSRGMRPQAMLKEYVAKHGLPEPHERAAAYPASDARQKRSLPCRATISAEPSDAS